MSPFVETLAVYERKPRNLSYHQARFDRTRRENYPYPLPPASLEEAIAQRAAELPETLVKFRILYAEGIEHIEWTPYTHRQVTSLALVQSRNLDYRYKYCDRSALNALFERRGRCDDIIIVNDGYISDASSSNLVFEEGSKLISPEGALLPGSCRARLLDEGTISLEKLRIEDLGRFSRVHLINAFRGLGDCVVELDADSLCEGEEPCR